MSDQYPPSDRPGEPPQGPGGPPEPPAAPPPEPAGAPSPPPATGAPPPPPPSSMPPPAPPAPDYGRPDHQQLRPRSFGELLSASWELYKDNWQILIAVTGVALVPLAILVALLDAIDNVGVQLVALVISLVLVTPLVTGAIIKAAADIYLGDEATLGTTYSYALARLLPLLGAVILASIGILLGLVLLIIPGLILVFRWYFVAQAVVVEDKGAGDAITRSWRLTKGHFWKIVGVVIVATLISALIGAIIALPFSAGSPAIAAVGEVLGQLIVQPWASLVGVLLYFDLRIRDEGFTMETMARELRS